MFGLCDCNNFYASCEALFDPRLAGRPVVVLSNNDGCVIARSAEAKALDIKMGAPLFKIRDVVQRHRVVVYSSNYTLYGDLSERVMATLSSLAPDLEVYSIDEAFLTVPPRTRPTTFGLGLRTRVHQWTGLPISIGLGPTKTLAKLANHVAKRAGWSHGVLDFGAYPDPDGLLDRVAVSDVWGVGPAYTKLLTANRIFSARQLRDACDRWVQRKMTIVGLRTVHELRGIVCYPLDTATAPRKNITHSRSFGERVTALRDLQQAVAAFVARAAEKLRRQGSVAGRMYVFVSTKHYGAGPHYSNGASVRLPTPTAFTPDLIRYAHLLLDRIYQPGYGYKQAGVMLQSLRPRTAIQGDLFTPSDITRQEALMELVDAVNGQYGRGTLFFGAAGVRQRRVWRPQQSRRSPRYTTRWAEILRVLA